MGMLTFGGGQIKLLFQKEQYVELCTMNLQNRYLDYECPLTPTTTQIISSGPTPLKTRIQ